ncbi:hypothetical protein M426DRAFT_13184 [Hypoxylon sp. CI-4A]|nr:hypothetical protein M426DRAFT_13184 [Hypoxylon sp. CI-4A]
MDQTQPSALTDLPWELILEICEHLPVPSQIHLAQTCQGLCVGISEKLMLGPDPEQAVKASVYVVDYGNLFMLSKFHSIVISNKKPGRGWDWFFSRYFSWQWDPDYDTWDEGEPRTWDTTLLFRALANDKIFEFLLDTITPSILCRLPRACNFLGSFLYWDSIMSTLKLAALNERPECVDLILDRPHLLVEKDSRGRDEKAYLDSPDFLNDFMDTDYRISVCMLVHLLERGFKLPRQDLIRYAIGYKHREEHNRRRNTERHFNDEICEFLIGKGANIDGSKDTYELTALERACEYFDFKSIDVLLRHGAAPNGARHGGEPLRMLFESFEYKASCSYHVEINIPGFIAIIRAFLERGASMILGSSNAHHAIRTFLDGVWAEIMKIEKYKPIKKVRTGTDQDRYVKPADFTMEYIVELLHYDEYIGDLSDLIVDADPDSEYAALSQGLRGRERLAKLIREVPHRNTFYWSDFGKEKPSDSDDDW